MTWLVTFFQGSVMFSYFLCLNCTQVTCIYAWAIGLLCWDANPSILLSYFSGGCYIFYPLQSTPAFYWAAFVRSIFLTLLLLVQQWQLFSRCDRIIGHLWSYQWQKWPIAVHQMKNTRWYYKRRSSPKAATFSYKRTHVASTSSLWKFVLQTRSCHLK